jgi:hypothetical protein
MMNCPTCKEWDIGEGPWESWRRCPNCDVHPDTSIYMAALRATNTALLEQLAHIKAWIQQPDNGITKRQLASAVVRMCDDALLTGGDELVAGDERTIEICSREILRLEKREHDLEAENVLLQSIREAQANMITKLFAEKQEGCIAQLEAKLRAVECAECEKTLLDCECE